MNKNIIEINNLLKKGDNFLISSHIRSDGDSIGSQLALFSLLKSMGKNVTIINEDPAPLIYRFLPYSDKIKNYIDKETIYDIAIILDCNEWSRIGTLAELVKSIPTIINIDHHPHNGGLGEYVYLDPTASSVSEQIYNIIKEGEFPINYESALSLYVGIFTDTGSFQQGNTSSMAHFITAELIERYGVSPEMVTQHVYKNNILSEVKLLGLTLGQTSITEDGWVAYSQITNQMIEDVEAKGLTIETVQIIDYLRSIKGVKVAVLFRDIGNNKVKVSLRSTPDINVGIVAKTFNGGGHPQAAGCVITGELNEVKAKLLKQLRDFL